MKVFTEEERQQNLREKEEHEIKRQKLGISKSQYKKLIRKEKFEESKETFRKIRREKKKEKKAQAKENGDDTEKEKKVGKLTPEKQTPTNVKCLVDCEFDDLMNEKEVKSLSNQVTRMYSAKRVCPYNVELEICSFDKRLKEQFDTRIPQYKLWKNIEFNEQPLKQVIEEAGGSEKFVYFTADTDEVIEELQPDTTYIIGGIVDKNRHKNLCVNKAKELGVKVGKLPIGKYIQLSGRQVLATSHVYEICCKWFEYQDWEKAFNEILPQRKLEKKVRRKRRNEEIQDQEETHQSSKDSESEAESNSDSESTN